MFSRIRTAWQQMGSREETPALERAPASDKPRPMNIQNLDIAPNDPLLAYLVSTPGVIEVDRLELDSPALNRLKEAGVRVCVPLVSQGELIGLLNLGPRLSEQEYSTDDKRLLTTLATQAAPALRVAQLARQQQVEARERERMENELRVARFIQQTLLPKELPDMPGWQVAAHWQPALAVSGDFYDFYWFPDGRLGMAVGDVTDKGVPAALVMATTRSILRSAAERSDSPGTILAQANDLLCHDIPPNMFVTCLYLILDPASGKISYANAGHNLPCQRTQAGVIELFAAGMPLGLMPGMPYDEREAELAPGEGLLLYSDGLVEAHNPEREMFGFPRLRELLARQAAEAIPVSGGEVIDYLLKELADFTGPEWEQEDDVTFVTLVRSPTHPFPATMAHDSADRKHWQVLAEFSLASEPGNEIQAMQLVADVVKSLDLPTATLERMKTAVAEGTMNAIEHGNKYQPDVPVEIEVLTTQEALAVRITDHGGGEFLPEPETPDLDAKLSGIQSPRGWGLFLIKNMVDQMNVHVGGPEHGGSHHTLELIFKRKGNVNDPTSV